MFLLSQLIFRFFRQFRNSDLSLWHHNIHISNEIFKEKNRLLIHSIIVLRAKKGRESWNFEMQIGNYSSFLEPMEHIIISNKLISPESENGGYYLLKKEQLMGIQNNFVILHSYWWTTISKGSLKDGEMWNADYWLTQ